MARMAPPTWTNQHLHLYHGTIERHAIAIMNDGVRVSLGMPQRDFGPGFYTTTDWKQARRWAEIRSQRSQQTSGAAPAVIEIEADRDLLAKLDTLSFVRGVFAAEDYWSFVYYCRMGATDHSRLGRPGEFFDVVYGPFARKWAQRKAAPRGDQISFHTARSEAVLNSNGFRRVLQFHV